ncbi:hypothetical protein FACS189491_07610 [Spirochaetia bacterium]|nr:hypothetical protein FACS189491_07610 [Spirochaetia bacterium]
MPRVVSVYAEEQRLVNVAVIQHEIMNNYIADMAKYASPQESIKIRACYNSIPNQLVKSRSLSVFDAQYGYDYAIRISAKNFGFENRIKSVPLYAVFCM